jgi:hypothetical protein
LKSIESLRATSAGQTSWTRDLARDLFSGWTTPFAWTLLRAPVETALRSVYTAVGAALTAPGEPFWRSEEGAVYLNAALIAQTDQTLAGAAWLGRRQPPAPGGLLARLQTGSTAKRCQARVAAAPGEAQSLQTRLSRWLTSVQGLRWTQADLLQVMEELEPHALAAFQVYFLARMGLNAAHAQLQARLAEWAPDCPSDVLAGLYLGVDGLPSASTAEAVNEAARLPAAGPARLAALARCSHRGPGEMRPDAHRWGAAPELLAHLAAQGDAGWRPARAAEQRDAALAEIRGRLDVGRYRQVDELLGRVHGMMAAADVAWDAMTMAMAAAQHWTAAAAQEAMAAGLIAHPGDVLYLELEELKQVATGEWHAGRSAGVQEAVEGRKRAVSSLPRPLSEGAPVVVSPGACEGPLYCDSPVQTLPPPDAIWLAESADPGCAPLWRRACAILATGDDIWAPGMIAARGMGAPASAGAAIPEETW